MKYITVRMLGKQFIQRWFNYEQPNFLVNNCQRWVKCWLITQLLGKILVNYSTWLHGLYRLLIISHGLYRLMVISHELYRLLVISHGLYRLLVIAHELYRSLVITHRLCRLLVTNHKLYRLLFSPWIVNFTPL